MDGVVVVTAITEPDVVELVKDGVVVVVVVKLTEVVAAETEWSYCYKMQTFRY